TTQTLRACEPRIAAWYSTWVEVLLTEKDIKCSLCWRFSAVNIGHGADTSSPTRDGTAHRRGASTANFHIGALAPRRGAALASRVTPQHSYLPRRFLASQDAGIRRA